jgi:hypothetical protein
MWCVNYKLYYSAVMLSFTGIYGSSLQYVYTILLYIIQFLWHVV